MKALIKIYEKSPIFIQNLFVSLKGYIQERDRVNKHDLNRQYNFLLKSQYWTKKEIEEYQLKMLKNILNEAFNYVPYYINLTKKLGLSINDFNSIEDLNKLPILTKKMIRGNEELFVNVNYKNKILTGSTSGTTGSPMKLYYSKESFSKRWAFELRLRKWAGLDNVLNPRRAQFTGKDIFISKKVFWRHNYAGNALLFSTTNINEKNIVEYVKALNKFRPEMIDGFPSAIYLIAKLATKNNLKLWSPKFIRTSAEVLEQENKEIIEKAFNTKVFDQYGTSESSLFCSYNTYGQMLIHPEYGYTELLDTDFDDEKKVITTCFLNNVMPLIRYDVGDNVKISLEKSKTKEGANFCVLEKVLGREDDIIEIDGIGSLARLTPALRDVQGIIESQIIFTKEQDFNIKLVIDKSGLFDEKLLENNLRMKVGNSIKIKFTYVNEIPRGANGKFKVVLNLNK